MKLKTVFENKMPNVCNLVKKSPDYNTKSSETENHCKYITTQECNELTYVNFSARLAEANLARKNDIANFVKKTDFDNKLENVNKNVT